MEDETLGDLEEVIKKISKMQGPIKGSVEIGPGFCAVLGDYADPSLYVTLYLKAKSEEKGTKQAMLDFIDQFVKTDFIAQVFLSTVVWFKRDISAEDLKEVRIRYESVMDERKLVKYKK